MDSVLNWIKNRQIYRVPWLTREQSRTGVGKLFGTGLAFFEPTRAGVEKLSRPK